MKITSAHSHTFKQYNKITWYSDRTMFLQDNIIILNQIEDKRKHEKFKRIFGSKSFKKFKIK